MKSNKCDAHSHNHFYPNLVKKFETYYSETYQQKISKYLYKCVFGHIITVINFMD